MPIRVNSFVPMVPAVFLAATIAVTMFSPALADSECIEQPGQQTAEGAHWYQRYNRAKGRKCWYLAETSTNVRNVTMPQGQANVVPASTFSSRLASLFGGLMGSSANVAPQNNSRSAPNAIQGNSTNAPKTENSVRVDQPDIAEERAGKRYLPALTQAKRNALFEDFLRWQENQQSVGRISPSTRLP